MKITYNEFMSYIEVQQYGSFNMLSSEAIEATGLNKEKYVEIMEKYRTLYNKYIKEEKWNGNLR